MNNILFTHVRVINPFGDPEFIESGSVAVSDGIIQSVNNHPDDDSYPGTKICMKGKTVIPGMINAHTHLYSSLALGMPPPTKNPVNFPEKLKSVWWKLDRALDKESTQSSYKIGLLNSIKNGVTTVIDHHSSQEYIDGSLKQLFNIASQFGIRISSAFEISEALDENLSAVQYYNDSPEIYPMVGLHASFTLSDKSLKVIADEINNLENTGIHIHVAEDIADERDAKMKGYHSVIQRLMKFKLLNEHSLIVHGIHMEPTDIDLLTKSGTSLVHCPTSNANNRVGGLAMQTMARIGTGLGTDGMQTNMLCEAKEGTLIKSASLPGGVESVNYLSLLFRNNPMIAQRLFNKKIGKLENGYTADLVFFEYDPATDLNSSNWLAHVLFGFGLPSDVISNGVFLLKDHKLVNIDETEIKNEARKDSLRLWEKMRNI
ncbi:MAG: amidohydrolase family protein [Fidelibacterota bacterium]